MGEVEGVEGGGGSLSGVGGYGFGIRYWDGDGDRMVVGSRLMLPRRIAAMGERTGSCGEFFEGSMTLGKGC